MGIKASKESLPLLSEHYYEFIVYSNHELYNRIGRLYEYMNSSEDNDTSITQFRYGKHNIRMIYSSSIEHVRRYNVPIIVSYDYSDRMSWYKSLDIIKGIKGNIILVSYGEYDRRSSVSIEDISQLECNHYELGYNIKGVMSTILDEHILKNVH